jgi:hypothetical protein
LNHIRGVGAFGNQPPVPGTHNESASTGTSRLTRQIALVLAEPDQTELASLLDSPRDEWMRAIRKARTRDGRPLTVHQLERGGRVMDLLAHVYHQGEWWELNVWNPLLDTRIRSGSTSPSASAPTSSTSAT